jgi:hypothetical protein
MNIRTLSVIAIVTAAISSPVLAQDADGSAPQKPAHALRHYSGAYNQVQGPASVTPRAYEGWSVHDDVDPSRPGGHNPDFNPGS